MPSSSPVITGQLAIATSSRKRCVNIATPAYGDTFSAAYVHSLFSMVNTGPKRQTRFTMSSVDVADIVLARNYLLSKFYFHQPECTHLLFLDDDMGFDVELLYDMLALKEGVVGALCPRRKLDLRKLHAAGELDFEAAYAQACSFIGKPVGPGPAPGFVEVKQCGTGILLIAREAIDRMIQARPDIVDRTRHRNIPLGKEFDQFLTPFSRITLADRELSEDLSFCYRWTEQCGGRIFANTDKSIVHVGQLTVSARYQDLEGTGTRPQERGATTV